MPEPARFKVEYNPHGVIYRRWVVWRRLGERESWTAESTHRTKAAAEKALRSVLATAGDAPR